LIEVDSLCNIFLVGRIPCKLLKNNISRDWIGEDEHLKIWMKV